MSEHAEPSNPLPERPLLRERIVGLLPYLLGAAALLLAVTLLGRELDRNLASIETWAVDAGPWGLLAFVGLAIAGTCLLLPESAFGLAAGAFFGLVWGAAAAWLANVVACALQYWLAHRLLRTRVQRAMEKRPVLAAIQRAVLHDSGRLQVLLRLAPLNQATVSYLLGTAGVRFRGFLMASLCTAPHVFMEAYLGHTGTRMARLAARGGGGVDFGDLVTLAGLVVCILVVVTVSRAARRAIRAAVAAEAAPSPPAEGDAPVLERGEIEEDPKHT